MSRKIFEFFGSTPKIVKMTTVKQEYQELEDLVPKITQNQELIQKPSNNIKEEPGQQFTIEFSPNQISNPAQHQKSNNCPSYQCKFCGKIFNSQARLQLHLKNAHGSKIGVLNCEICSLKFIQRTSFELHKRSKHPDGKAETFECDIDGKVFQKRGAIVAHMKSHKLLTKCKICNAELTFRYLNMHMKLIHSSGQTFQCNICQKTYTSAKHLSVHKKRHDKQIECQICSKKFSIQYDLNIHVRDYHENPKSYECAICFKKYNEKGDLRKHQKTHDKNRLKRHKCQRCDYATDNLKSHKDHQLVHKRLDKKHAAMKKSFKCQKCPKQFKEQYLVTQHMKIVHPDNFYQCDLCGKYLKSFRAVQVHINFHIKISL